MVDEVGTMDWGGFVAENGEIPHLMVQRNVSHSERSRLISPKRWWHTAKVYGNRTSPPYFFGGPDEWA